MACKPRMAGCRATCLHRQLVTEYRAARQAAEARREQLTAMYAAEVALHGPIVTFRDWLIQTARGAQDVAA